MLSVAAELFSNVLPVALHPLMIDALMLCLNCLLCGLGGEGGRLIGGYSSVAAKLPLYIFAALNSVVLNFDVGSGCM